MKHFSVVFKFLFKFCSDDTNFLKISYCKFWSRQVSQPVLLSLHCLLSHLMAILKGRTSLFNFQSVCNKYEPRHEKNCFCICKNKSTDLLRGGRPADQHLYFRYIDSTILLLPKSKISKSPAIFSGCTARFVLPWPKVTKTDRFSHDTAHIWCLNIKVI